MVRRRLQPPLHGCHRPKDHHRLQPPPPRLLLHGNHRMEPQSRQCTAHLLCYRRGSLRADEKRQLSLVPRPHGRHHFRRWRKVLSVWRPHQHHVVDRHSVDTRRTGLCLLLHIITMLVIIPFPLPKYKALNVAGTGIATSFRALLLAFYSTPPSNDIILCIRRMFFPSSFRGSKVNDVNSSARSEMQQNPGIQLPDVQSTTDSINNAEVTAV
ncbi:hypothetical protein BC938DRAFT_472344 [Jimgerdemannia flammicorona]|uniref:Uncharacterized protein n=1 Tax=Jimgerdemannia flammicorona TaxID=994334 RepID=A0A433Q6D1_9FUNG|nr:hypothetical protein BC938DRAFT_472344 [Jimgerdemannia flammicorona]